MLGPAGRVARRTVAAPIATARRWRADGGPARGVANRTQVARRRY
jgi:hypothetical protein